MIAHALLALMLLIAQLGAEAHAYSHLGGHDQDHAGVTQECGQCVASAALFGAAPLPVSELLPYRWEIELLVPVADFTLAAAPYSLPFQARGPPELL